MEDKKVRKLSRGLDSSSSLPDSSELRDCKKLCAGEESEIADDASKAGESKPEAGAAAATVSRENASGANADATTPSLHQGPPAATRCYERRRSQKKSEKPSSDEKPEVVVQQKPSLNDEVTGMSSKVEKMEQDVSEMLKLRKAALKERPLGISVTDDDREKALEAIQKQRSMEVARRQAGHAKRSADLMRQFGNILRQLSSHKWAWPFMQPVDVEGLQLHDYFDIIKKPMDFGTIKEKMDSNVYKGLQEVADDMRLVFSNAMTYNAPGSDVYLMAKTLSEKFEEKWKAVLEPKLQEEIKRRQEQQEMEVQETEQIKAAEAAALDRRSLQICSQLNELEEELEELKVRATAKCRAMTIEEKRHLGQNLVRLPMASLNRVLQIISRKDPGVIAPTEEVEVDMEKLDTGTLWQLHSYVQMILYQQKQQNLSEGGALQRTQPVPAKKRPAAKLSK